MTDQAIAWKAGFGALLLLFSGASFVIRKHAEFTQQPVPAAVAAKLAAPASSLAPSTQVRPEESVQPAPLDVQEDAPPVRVEVTLHDGDEATLASPDVRAKPGKPPQRLAPASNARTSKYLPPNVQRVSAKRSRSPYQPGRTHYPYDPRERWALRDTP
jgi:hypothetical protein